MINNRVLHRMNSGVVLFTPLVENINLLFSKDKAGTEVQIPNN